MRGLPHTRWVAGASVLALALTACGGSSGSSGGSKPSATGGNASGAVTGGVLNMLGAGDVDYMDPNLTYYSIGYLGMRPWTRQPYSYPADADVKKAETAVPDLATDMPKASADGKSVTWTIREGAKWNTAPARQVTAEDAIRGVKITCNPTQPFGGFPDYSDLFVGFAEFCAGFGKVKATDAAAVAEYVNSHDVAGLKVGSDARTVVMTLTHPAAYMADLMTLPAFSPRPKEYDKYLPASAELAQHTISDGPYQIASYKATKAIDFTRNKEWDAKTDPIRKAYVDEIKINETVAQESTQEQLQTGTPTADMEFDNFPPATTLPALISAKDPNLNLGPTSSSNPYVLFNFKSPNNNGALAKPEVRQALAYGMNRDNMIQVLGGPKVSPKLSHILPSSLLGGETDFDPYPYDTAKAKSMLASAGFPKGMTLKFLYRNASEGSTKTFQVIQQDLSKIGVKVVGVPVPNADFYTKYLQVPSVAARGVWDLSLAGWGSDWYGNAALTFFNPLFAGKPSFPPQGSNYGYYDSAATNALIKSANAATTEDQAKTLWAQADQQTMKDAAIYPVTQPLQPNYHAKQVKNAIYVPAMQQFDPTNVWLDKNAQGG